MRTFLIARRFKRFHANNLTARRSARASITGTVPVSLIEADEHPKRTPDKIVEIAGKMIAEHDRLGTLGGDIEKEDWETYDALEEQLWLPSQFDVTAKARVLDQRLRCGGNVHSVLHVDFAWDIIDDLFRRFSAKEPVHNGVRAG